MQVIRQRRLVHVAAPGQRVVPVLVQADDEDKMQAARSMLPTLCADFAAVLDDEVAPNTRPGALQTPRTTCERGLRFTSWTERTEASFVVFVAGVSRKPTRQTLHVVVELDATAPAE